MNIKVNQSSSQEQPKISMEERLLQLKSNALQHLQSQQSQNANPQQNLETIIEEVVKKYLKNLSPQPQQNENELQNDFIVKANMKASVVAVRAEHMLLTKKKVVLTALGFAIPIELDSIMLIRKDLERLGSKVSVQFELFERETTGLNGKRKTITGLRTILTI